MNRRINFVAALFFLLFILITLRLFYWQVLSFEQLGGLAEKQRSVTLSIPAARGRIYSSDGSPLVINQRSFGVVLEPKKVQDKETVFGVLSKELNIPIASISAKLTDDTKIWVPIAHKIDEPTVEKIKGYKLMGIDFIEESKRYYPEASMAAHILGFVGKNAKGEDQGYFGIEGYYDEQLRGRDGVLREEADARGNPILAGDQKSIPAENGRDLILYIDKTVQFIVENKLKQGIDKYKAKGGTAVVLDSVTGGIIADASFSSYDPGTYYKFPSEFYKNPAVSSSYEPGSTFKVLVMAAALNEGKLKPDAKFNEEGPVEIGDYTIKTWNQKYHGEITLTQILEYSSNVGMVFVEKSLDKNVFLQYLGNFGLGRATNVDLQEEIYPEMRQKNKWYEIDYATASFGQGVVVTPLQMVRAVAAIANSGKLMVPHVVKSINFPDGRSVQIKPQVERVIVKPEVAKTVTEMMVSAVNNGEVRFAKPAGYRIAGKTGTAQIPIAGHYDTEKTIASFVGFAPADSPKFVMLVTLDSPSASPWGSETAAPIFFDIAKELFSYYGISPSD
jgi:cell division protein FtsI/penicillin-binding protein 2